MLIASSSIRLVFCRKICVAKDRIGLPQIPTGQNGRGELCSWPQVPAGTEDS